MIGQIITAPEGADTAVWWQEAFDKAFPDGLLAIKKKEPPGSSPEVMSEDMSADPVLRVPRVEVLREEEGALHVIFVGKGWDIGVDGLVTQVKVVQEHPCLVWSVTLQDGPVFWLSNGITEQLKRILRKDRQELVGFSQANGKSMHA